MAIDTSYALIASMNVRADKEELFNEVYEEHCGFLMEVPGVRSVTRMKGEPFGIAIGDGIQRKDAPDPVYTAIYEIDDPSVLESAEWAAAVEKGRWPGEIRPYTSDRIHHVYKKL